MQRVPQFGNVPSGPGRVAARRWGLRDIVEELADARFSVLLCSCVSGRMRKPMVSLIDRKLTKLMQPMCRLFSQQFFMIAAESEAQILLWELPQPLYWYAVLHPSRLPHDSHK